MASIIRRITDRKLVTLPKAVRDNTQYEALTGSVSYGVSDDTSDIDLVGFCIPSKDVIFPHLRGEIPDFGRQAKRFHQFQKHHIQDDEAGKTYDVTVYNIVRYFQLCMDNNPNMIDSLFVPDTCILRITKVGTMVREARRDFLHKGVWHRMKGYAYSQLHKADGKSPQPGSKRAELRAKYGHDVKFLYHVVRLMLEAEQILAEGDLDLMRGREQLKAIRRGEVGPAEVRSWFASKEAELEKLYASSTLRYKPDEQRIKQLLLNCLEEHYGNLSDAIVLPDQATQALREVSEVLSRYESLLG